MHDLFQNLVSEFGQECGIPNLSPNADGELRLLFDRSISVSMMPTSNVDELLIYSHVGHVAEQTSVGLLLRLLDASLFGQSTNGAVFAIDELTEQITLQRIEQIQGMTYQDFESLIEEFVNAVEYWSQQIQDSDGFHSDTRVGTTLCTSALTAK
ncbi:type III secretion system chaperone [Thalassoglobus sp. JC818]|uniref:type III secretion system chaperone n=1 Tax=Thalassoglobus sp. JC818 TaxID=3232136 RepID=UPI003457B39F